MNVTSAQLGNPTTTSDTGAPIIGAAAGGITLLLVSVLGIIICTIAIVRTRRGKRNRKTLHDQPVLFTTLQVGEQDTLSNTLPTGEHQQDNYNTGGLYDEVVIKPKPQPSIPSGYEVTYDYGENKMTGEDNKNDSKRKDIDGASSVKVYALPDKQKGKKTDDKGRKEQDSQDPELLYTKVNKQAKTERKEETYKVNALMEQGKTEPQNDNAGIIEQQQNISPPDFRPGYEPIADGDSTPQQQDGEENTTQPTPSATVEGLYAEVDKTQKKNKKKDEE